MTAGPDSWWRLGYRCVQSVEGPRVARVVHAASDPAREERCVAIEPCCIESAISAASAEKASQRTLTRYATDGKLSTYGRKQRKIYDTVPIMTEILKTDTSSCVSEVTPESVHEVLGRNILADGMDLVLDLERSRGSLARATRAGRSFVPVPRDGWDVGGIQGRRGGWRATQRDSFDERRSIFVVREGRVISGAWIPHGPRGASSWVAAQHISGVYRLLMRSCEAAPGRAVAALRPTRRGVSRRL